MASGRKLPRRKPRQRRSQITRNAIFEAAAQILERDGEGGFNTNRVAERAGVSVGTLYQYFANKEAILVALAQREMASLHATTASEANEACAVERRALRAFINVLNDRPATRRAMVKAVVACETPRNLGQQIDATSYLLPHRPGASRLDAYILSRAVVGVVRAAVLEGYDKLHTRAFEDGLVRLIDGYRTA
jgi:AcrR family transcriptional regulator